MSNTGQAWVTLATNDSYALGALVLAQSLKRNNTIHQLAILITPGISPAMKEVLSSTFDLVKEVDILDSKDAANLALLARPDLGITFTKLHCWNLTQYTKCVFLDADTLVIRNCDELFERDELSAAPDAGWPDCFNSGVFVYTPSEATFKALVDYALAHGSFDGGDQGLLNMFFSDWATKDIEKHLPFIYNMVASATYSYLPAFKAFGSRVKIAHFIGSNKPWLQARPDSSTLSDFLNLWWNIFLSDVSTKLNTNMIINCTVFEEGPQASKLSTPPPSPPGTELRHVFVDPWDYVHQGQSKSDSTNSLNTEDVIDRLVEHLKETQRNQNQAGTVSNPNRPQMTYTKQFSVPNLAPRSQGTAPTQQNMFDLKKISGSLPVLQPTRQSQNHYNHSHLEQVREGQPLRRAESYENLPSTISPPFTPCVEQTSLQEQTHERQDTSQQGGLAGALAGGQKDVIEDTWRRQAWEQGNIDYMGADAFENIWKKISKTVGESIKPLEGPVPEAPVGVEPEPSAEVLAQVPSITESPATPVAEVPASPPADTAVSPAAEAPALPASAPVPEEVSATLATENPAPAASEAPPSPASETPAASAAATPAASAAATPAASAAATPAASAAATPAAPTGEVPVVSPAKTSVAPAPEAPELPASMESATQPPIADKPMEIPEKTEDKTDAPKPEGTKPSQQADQASQESASEEKPAPQAEQPPTEAAVASTVPTTVVDEPVAEVATTIPTSEKPSEPSLEALPQEAITTPAAVESASPPMPEPLAAKPVTEKEPSQLKEDPKSSDPKDGEALTAATLAPDDSTPSSPAVPSPASPGAPEGAHSEPAPTTSETKADTSTPPQTPVGEPPVPPKRSSKKGKAKK